MLSQSIGGGQEAALARIQTTPGVAGHGRKHSGSVWAALGGGAQHQSIGVAAGADAIVPRRHKRNKSGGGAEPYPNNSGDIAYVNFNGGGNNSSSSKGVVVTFAPAGNATVAPPTAPAGGLSNISNGTNPSMRQMVMTKQQLQHSGGGGGEGLGLGSDEDVRRMRKRSLSDSSPFWVCCISVYAL